MYAPVTLQPGYLTRRGTDRTTPRPQGRHRVGIQWWDANSKKRKSPHPSDGDEDEDLPPPAESPPKPRVLRRSKPSARILVSRFQEGLEQRGEEDRELLLRSSEQASGAYVPYLKVFWAVVAFFQKKIPRVLGKFWDAGRDQ
jgi:hypothetical protein